MMTRCEMCHMRRLLVMTQGHRHMQIAHHGGRAGHWQLMRILCADVSIYWPSMVKGMVAKTRLVDIDARCWRPCA